MDNWIVKNNNKDIQIYLDFFKRYKIAPIKHKIILKSKIFEVIGKEISVELFELIKLKLQEDSLNNQYLFFNDQEVCKIIQACCLAQTIENCKKNDNLHLKFIECIFYFLERKIFSNPSILCLYEYLLEIYNRFNIVSLLLIKILEKSYDFFDLLRSKTVNHLILMHRNSEFKFTFIIPYINPTEIVLEAVLIKGPEPYRKIIYQYLQNQIKNSVFEKNEIYIDAISLDDFEKIKIEDLVTKYFKDCSEFYKLILSKEIKLHQRHINLLCHQVLATISCIKSFSKNKIEILSKTTNKEDLLQSYQIYLSEAASNSQYGRNINASERFTVFMVELSLKFGCRNILKTFINDYSIDKMLPQLFYFSNCFELITDLTKFIGILEKFDEEVTLRFIKHLRIRSQENISALGKHIIYKNILNIYYKIKNKLHAKNLLTEFLKILNVANNSKKKDINIKRLVFDICIDFYGSYDDDQFIVFYMKEIKYEIFKILISLSYSQSCAIDILVINSVGCTDFYNVLNYVSENAMDLLKKKTLDILHQKVSEDLEQKNTIDTKHAILDVNYCSMLYFLKSYDLLCFPTELQSFF
ncbi:hypothetical protein NUSPORA_01527 [Nucleospora cyclopteri]